MAKVPKLDFTRLNLAQQQSDVLIQDSAEDFLSKSMLNAAEMMGESLGMGTEGYEGDIVDPEDFEQHPFDVAHSHISYQDSEQELDGDDLNHHHQHESSAQLSAQEKEGTLYTDKDSVA